MFGRGLPSSSRTDSPIVTEVSWFEYCKTIILVNSIPRLRNRSVAKTCHVNGKNLLIGYQLGQLRMAIAREQLDRVCGHFGRRGRNL